MTRIEPFFQAGSASADYALIRDDPSPDITEARRMLEAMWVPFAPHADPNFRQEAMTSFRARFWELYLFTVLRAAGLSPRGRPSGGPDFVLDGAGRRAFVEATAATVGLGADRVPEVKYGEVVELPERELLLRLTAPLEEKSRRGTHYLQNGLLCEDEPFVIAINGAVNISAMTDCRVPESFRVPRILQVLFGIGHYTMSIAENGEVEPQGFSPRATISKLNGTDVPSTLFRSNAHAHVSAVIFGLEYARSFDLSGRNLVLVHNPFARTPWPRGLLKRGVEYWQEGGTLGWTDWHADPSGPPSPPPHPRWGVDE